MLAFPPRRRLSVRWIVVLAAVSASAFFVSPGLAATNVAITSPVSGSHADTGSIVPVAITASSDSGVYAVQMNVDGVPWPNASAWDSTPTGQYQYSINWDTTGLTAGTHVLTATAMDWSQPFPNGATQVSAPVTVDVGPALPTISLTTPTSFSFVRGSSAPVSATFTSAANPATVKLT